MVKIGGNRTPVGARQAVLEYKDSAGVGQPESGCRTSCKNQFPGRRPMMPGYSIWAP